MAEPYVGEIRMFGGTFAPVGWAICDGSLMPISEYETLFTLIGTTYGGDGEETFALPDLQGRIPLHFGRSRSGDLNPQIGENGGVEQVALLTQQIPAHNHVPVAASSFGSANSPAGAVWAASPDTPFAPAGAPMTQMGASLEAVGGSQPHDNLPPYLALTFIISLFGIFPSQS